MSRSKAALALLVCLCLGLSSAQAQQPSLITPEMMQTETAANQNAVEVKVGVYEKINNASAEEYYPRTYDLGTEVNNAFFAEYHVTRRQEVQAGQVLATFTLEMDEERYASAQLTLDRTQREYARGKELRLEEIDLLLKQQLEITDVYERELAELRIRRAKLAYEQYCYQQQCLILDYEEQLAEMEEQSRRTQLIAPFDGIVSDLTYKRVGERIYAYEPLVTMYREEDMLLRIANKDQNFRYGMTVTVTSGAKANQQVFEGHVVAADDLLPESRRQGYALIKLVPNAAGDKPRYSSIKVSGATQQLANVLLIPRKAAALDGGKYYVETPMNGSAQKRYVNIGLLNNTNAWVVQGLNEGDKVIAD